jgi:glycosyltransferase involved in cell wall biosynthesis
MPRPRLVYVVTHGATARLLLRGQLAWMRAQGFEVVVIASPGPDLELVREREGVETIAVDMARSVALGSDLAALVRLTMIMRRLRPAIVNASTTKAGLLGMLAARAASVPARIYLLRGLRLETTSGATRAVLELTERLAAACAHRVVAVSPSLARRFVEGGYAPEGKVRVLGHGTSNGVDVERFASSPALRARAAALRVELGIPMDAPVIGFVGRMVADKGIYELLDAFTELTRVHPAARLLLVGDDLAGDVAPRELVDRIRADRRMVIVGHVPEPTAYYLTMNVLAFPSFREGFPNVPLEAAAAGIPVVGFRATGVVDAVEDGCTGLLVPQRDVRSFTQALLRYLDDPGLATTHGAAGQARVQRDFSREHVWRAWGNEYAELLETCAMSRRH